MIFENLDADCARCPQSSKSEKELLASMKIVSPVGSQPLVAFDKLAVKVAICSGGTSCG